jgi:hypothetical protein
MKMLLSALALLSGPAAAQDWMLRDTDEVLDRSAMEAQVIGATHEFYDGGRSFFSISGSYSYTYSSGEVAYGSWRWPDDSAPGVICTDFRAGFFARCDMYVRARSGLVLLTTDGLRLPVRVNSADG